jgi:hypothetical protein
MQTCDEKLRLLVEYQGVTQAYSAAIAKMVVKGISQAEYRHFRALTEKARHSSMAARDRLERHIAEHGC